MSSPTPELQLSELWPRSYYIQTYGCQMNVYDSEIIGALLEQRGCQPAASEEEAEIVVFNTCCIRDNADQKVYGRLGDFKERRQANPRFTLVVAGCLAQKDRDQLQERFPHIDLVLGTHQVKNLNPYLDQVLLQRGELRQLKAQANQSVQVRKLWKEAKRRPGCGVQVDKKGHHLQLPASPQSSFQAMVPISVGCNQWCTYCIVPHVRGPLHSRGLSEIVAEVERLLGEGYKEITLLGQNVNDYGRDLRLQEGFAQILQALTPEKVGKFRLRFTSPHPAYFTPAAIEAMAANPNVCPHVHLPLQAGDDEILKIMHRGYTAQQFLDLAQRMRQALPGLALTTDIIVGFAGESEEQFQHTLQVVRAAQFDSAFMFACAERPGTPGSEYPSQVPEEVRLQRLYRLIEHQNAISQELNRQRLGLEVELLVEGPSKKGATRYSGRTPQHWLVHFDAPQDLSGQLVRVRLSEAYLWGFVGQLL